MADSTEGDALLPYLDLLTTAIFAFLPGLMIHSYIIGVNLNDWWKGRSVTSVDHIVTSLGISRMCAQGSFTISIFLASFFQSTPESDVTMLSFTMAYCFFTHSNIWIITLLSIVFCLKISNLRSRLFLYLRRIILPRTGRYIIASVLLAVVTSFMSLWSYSTKVANNGSCNSTIENQFMDDKYLDIKYNFTIGASAPMIFCYIFSVLLFTSLYHHTVKMKMSSNLSINLETYYSAMKFVSFTFMYNIIYYLSLLACIFYFNFFWVKLSWFHIFFGFLPVLHSSYLIYRTAKLRSQMSKVLKNIIDLLFTRNSTETRANIELVAQ